MGVAPPPVAQGRARDGLVDQEPPRQGSAHPQDVWLRAIGGADENVN